MFRAERSPAWLYNTVRRLSLGEALSQDELDRLAAGFVGCNNVMQLTVILHRFLQKAPLERVFVNGVRYTDVHTWLQSRIDHGGMDNLVNDGAAIRLETKLKGNTWALICIWMAMESLYRIVRGAPSETAHEHIQSCFSLGLKSLSSSGPDPAQPKVCRDRSKSVLAEFERFQSGVTAWLTTTIEEQVTSGPDLVSPADLGRVLKELRTELQTALTRQTAIQADLCIRQLWPHPPISRSEVRKLSAKLIAAWDLGLDCRFADSEKRDLRIFFEWCAERSVRIGETPIKDTGTWAQVSGPDREFTIPSPYVLGFMNDWNSSQQAVRPANLHNERAIQDLLACRIRPRLSEAHDWIEHALSLGL